MELHRFFRYAIEKMCKEKKSLNHFNLYKRGEKMLYIPVNISFCEAVYGVSSVNKIAVKKECARIRGVDHTLTWKIKILGKQVEYGIKQIIEYLIPASFLKEMKIRNRKRLEHRK